MIGVGCTYLIVKNMERSIKFYEELFELKAKVGVQNRWVEFNISGNCISLFNPEFDLDCLKEAKNEKNYNKEYIKYIKETKISYGNNIVLNLGTDNLNKEFERLKKKEIGEMTNVMFMNISSPYHCFIIKDPDGNTIEITGVYKDRKNDE